MSKVITAHLSLEHGRFLPDDTTRRVEEPTLEAIGDIPDNCFMVRFTEHTEVRTEDGEVLRGQHKSIGKNYYIGGEVKSLTETPETPETNILRENVSSAGLEHYIVTRRGRTLLFDPQRDVLLPVEKASAES